MASRARITSRYTLAARFLGDESDHVVADTYDLGTQIRDGVIALMLRRRVLATFVAPSVAGLARCSPGRSRRMLRSSCVVVAVSGALVGVAACGSSGVHTQDGPSRSTSSTPGTSQAGTTTPTPQTTWVAPAYGTAQPAVDLYLQFFDRERAALSDPAHPPADLITQLQGQAQLVATGSIADEVKQGRAWRGTAAVPRVLVVSNIVEAGDLPAVVLSDCPFNSSTDPWIEYDQATGKQVQDPMTQSPPPPYEITAKLFQPNRQQWVMTSFTVDSSKTCTR